MTPRTGAERYFADQQRDKEYQAAYKAAKARIAKIDELVRALDERRAERGLTKAQLARQAGLQPEVVRRLFTMVSPNPTAATLMALADVLGLELVTRPKRTATEQGSAAKARKSSSSKKLVSA
ncbi:MAG: hypothetical protein QOF21_2193 [Actinomycetota bacterium]|jgi:DNA-binding phage protein